jgi:hypothetical protein
MSDSGQPSAEGAVGLEMLVSKTGRQLRTETLGTVIADEPLRAQWQAFDERFLERCIQRSARGIAFDGEAFQAFWQPDYAPLLPLGVTVYNACAKAMFERPTHDYMAFLRLSQIYLSARMALQRSR